VRNDAARPGDHLILTKGIAIEGTALIAREKAEALRGVVEEALLARARGLLEQPGLSVVRDAAVVCDAVKPHALQTHTSLAAMSLPASAARFASAYILACTFSASRAQPIERCALFSACFSATARKAGYISSTS
jgi:hypothetical protein